MRTSRIEDIDTLEPGVIGGVERTKQLFGRALEAHEIAEREKVRADELLD